MDVDNVTQRGCNRQRSEGDEIGKAALHPIFVVGEQIDLVLRTD